MFAPFRGLPGNSRGGQAKSARRSPASADLPAVISGCFRGSNPSPIIFTIPSHPLRYPFPSTTDPLRYLATPCRASLRCRPCHPLPPPLPPLAAALATPCRRPCHPLPRALGRPRRAGQRTPSAVTAPARAAPRCRAAARNHRPAHFAGLRPACRPSAFGLWAWPGWPLRTRRALARGRATRDPRAQRASRGPFWRLGRVKIDVFGQKASCMGRGAALSAL